MGASPAEEARRPRAVPRPARRPAVAEAAASVPGVLPGEAAPLRQAEDLLRSGRISEACAVGEAVVARSPDAGAAWRFLGRCYMRLSQPGKARACYRRYLAVAPSAPDASFVRAIIDGDVR
jgi:Flp pilus assembly protein TadD